MKRLATILILLMLAQPAYGAVDTFYPEASIATKAGDGSVAFLLPSPLSYAVVNGSTVGTDANNAEAFAFVENSSNTFFDIRRLYFNFSTESIFTGNYIESGTLSLHGSSTESATDGYDLWVVANNQADPAALGTGDYDDLGSTELGSVTIASSEVEIKRPASHTDDAGNVTSETNAYDGNLSTQSAQPRTPDNTPAFRIYNIPDTTETYSALDLVVYYEAINNGGNDEYQIQWSGGNTAGTCDSGTWNTIVGFTAANASNNTVATTSLSASQDLSDICVRVNVDRIGGADSNSNVYIEEVYTYGTYVDTGASQWSSSGYNDIALNSTGVAEINSGGGAVSSFGARLSSDVNVETPTGRNTVDIVLADETGTSKDPKLQVIHYGLADMTMGMGF